MVFIVSIISGINATIWGISSLSRRISGRISLKSSVMMLMPSRVSNTDRRAQHTGML